MRRLTLATAPALSLRARPLYAVNGTEPASDLEATRKVLSSSDIVPSLRGRGVDTGVYPSRRDEEATNFYAVHALSPEDLMGAADDDEAPRVTDEVQAIEATVILASRPAAQAASMALSPEELDEAPASVTMVDAAPPSPSAASASTPFVFSLMDAYAPEPAVPVASAPPMPAPMRALAPTVTVPRPVAPIAPRRVWPVVALFVVTFAALAAAFVLTMPRPPGAPGVVSAKTTPLFASVDAAPRLASRPVDEELDAPVATRPAAKAVAASPRVRPHVAPRPAKVEVPTESEELAQKQIDAL